MIDKILAIFKKIILALLALNNLAVGALAVIQLFVYFQKESVVTYNEPYIPLVYMDIAKFREFLNANSGKKVIFNTQISFDAVLAVNHLAHEICGYDTFLDVVNQEPGKIESVGIGMMKFEKGFVDPKDSYFYNAKENRYKFNDTSIKNVSCYDTLRLKMKDPSRLRLSFGGTGTISLLFQGTFMIEKRFFGGPRIEYTLREL